MQFQIVSWVSGDEGPEGRERYLINIFGRTEQGEPVHVKVHYKPCFYLKCNMFPAVLMERFRDPEKIRGKRSVWGYTPNDQTFYKLKFDSLRARKYGEYACKTFPIFEANIDPVLRFMHEKSIASTGWVEIPDGFVNGSEIRPGYMKPVCRSDIAPLRIMSLDIECFSEDGSFPDPRKPNDCIFQIAMTTRKWGSSEIEECLLCMSEYKTEKVLLEEFAKKMRQIDPDIVTGWNIFGFDLEYLYRRLVVCKCNLLAYYWGRGKEIPVTLVTKRLASNALGSNLLNMVPMFGRYVFDLFQEVKREQKFESYTLNNVSKVLLSDQKIDMPIKEMFQRFARWKESQDPEELRSIGEYCIKDTLLPHRIMDRLCTIPNLIEMAKATWVPLNYLSERGQQIKVFSQIAKKAAELGFMIPTKYQPKDGGLPDEKYKGATVLDADIGAYYDPVAALDFASLYPSIMMAHNLCYSTILLDGATHPDEELVGAARYVQNVPALLPEVLRELKQFRKQAKKDMARAKGTPMEEVYNAKQLAYKVSMNSVYGFTGATKGFLPLVDIASSVTAKGREMIQQTKELVEREFEGAKVRYGDSVMPYTPVMLRDSTGKVYTKSIESISDSLWEPYPGFMKEGTNKEHCELSGIDAFTHLGWSKINRVIRHKCIKRIYRVSTYQQSSVDVTEDHSLIDSNGKQIKPNDVMIGRTKLLSCSGSEIVSDVRLLHESYDGLVYDIETESGSFQAGVGQIIVKNTDSVMVQFDVGDLKGQDAIRRSWELGEQASKKVQEILRDPNELELEKVYCPYFLYSKKRYAARKWTLEPDGTLESSVDVKGLQLVRRDTCPFVRNICKKVLDSILESPDPRPVITMVRCARDLLLSGEVPMDELTLTRSLAAEYKSQNLAHVKVRDKIRERTPGSEPKSGDRIPFVLLVTDKKQKAAYEKAEDPEWVREHGLVLDYQHYFKNHMKKPVTDLLEPIIDAKDLWGV
jgi:DNA polymerase delta subunit 1